MISSGDFRGFGERKIRAHNKEKTSLRKALKQIRNLAKGKKHEGILQEYRRIEAASQARKDLPGSNPVDGNAPNAAIEGEGDRSNQGDALRLDNSRNFWTEACNTASGSGNVEASHQREWDASLIDPDITNLNVKSLSRNAPYDYLCYSDKLKRLNTGALNSFWMRRYAHIYKGGWWCSGIDVFTGEDSQWGCFKSDEKHIDDEGKPIKYEHPPKIATEIFALKIPHHLWQLAARRYDVMLPENYQDLPHSAFWKWVIDHSEIPLIITEGCKKAAAVLSCGYACIAVPGIWNGIRQPKDEDGNPDGMASLIPQLQVFAQPGRRIYFCLDQDSKRNTVRAVNKAIAKTAKLFLLQKCEVKIITWHAALGKGVDDVLIAFGREKFDEFYRGSLTFDEWSSQQLRQLTYTPDMLINKRYIGEVLPPASAQLIGVRAPKGCGKTEWLRWLTDPQLSSGERKTLLITHRIQLGLQTTSRLNLPFVSQLKDTEQGSLFGYGLCIDSLHALSQARFNPHEWRGAWVIIDEIQQVIWHLLSSNTCQKERVVIVKTLQELLRTVISTGGKIILCDADLNDVGIDFIEGLLGFSPERFILINEFKFNQPWTVYKFGGKNPAGMIAELEKRLQAGEKALLCLSGQKSKSRWGTQVLEEYFKRKYPNLRILRIDSESVANPEHEACGCTQDLNKIITNYDLVLASPTIETGVSIDAHHFDGVWYVGQGVQTADGARQHLSRVRPPVPRYVWIKSVGINFVGNGVTTPAGLIGSQKRLDKANRNKLTEAGLQEMPDGNFSPICLEAWAKLGAIINLGMWRYEASILAGLKEEGHIVVDWKDEEKDDQNTNSPDTVEKEVDKVRDEVYRKYREDVSAANNLTDAEYEKLNKQQQRKTDELLQLRKGAVERKYLVPVSPELIEKDDNRWGSKLRLHYFWDVGRQYLAFKDSQLAEKAIVNGQGDYFIVDSNKGLMQLKIGVFNYLGVNRLYQETRFHGEHSVIKDIVQKISDNLYNLKLVLGIDFGSLSKNPKKRIECIQVLLGLIGHKMVCYDRKGKRSKQIRYYSSPAPEFQRDPETNKLILGGDGLPIPFSDGREEVYEAWLQRDAELKRKAEEEKAAALATAAAEAERKQQQEALLQEKLRVSKQEKQEWLREENLEEIARWLEACENGEMLWDLRQCYPDFAMKAAADLLPSKTRARIREWVIQQNQQSAA